MVEVKTVPDFITHNDSELRSFFVFKTGIYDKVLQDEAIQEFYVKMIETHALESYPESYLPFKTYVCNLLCWTLPQMKKANVRACYNMVSTVTVSIGDSNKREVDVWEYVGNHNIHSDYSVDATYTNSLLEHEDESTLERELDDFISYVRRTEPEKKANRIETFVKHKMYGCKAIDIAKMLGVSNNMVKIIKDDAYRKFKRWSGRG